MAVPHLTVDLRLGNQRGDRVDHDDVDRSAAHQHLDDLERLLAGVRLRDQQLLGVHADARRVLRIERVLGVDERGDAAATLRLGDDVQRERRLARRLRAVDLDDAAARDAADTERDVQGQRTGRDDVDVLSLYVAETHDRSLSVGSLDLSEGRLQCPIPLSRHRLTPLVTGRSSTPPVHFYDRLDSIDGTTC